MAVNLIGSEGYFGRDMSIPHNILRLDRMKFGHVLPFPNLQNLDPGRLGLAHAVGRAGAAGERHDQIGPRLGDHPGIAGRSGASSEGCPVGMERQDADAVHVAPLPGEHIRTVRAALDYGRDRAAWTVMKGVKGRVEPAGVVISPASCDDHAHQRMPNKGRRSLFVVRGGHSRNAETPKVGSRLTMVPPSIRPRIPRATAALALPRD